MSIFPPIGETWMINLECLGDLDRPRFLNGDTLSGKVSLVANTDPSGTWWAVTTLSDGVLKFRCMGAIEGLRFLDGRTHDGSVGLAPVQGVPFSGERWSFSPTDGAVTLRSRGHVEGNRVLEGLTVEGQVRLAPDTPALSGMRWRVHHHGQIVALECLGHEFGDRFLDGRTQDSSVGLAPMAIERFTGTYWLMQDINGVVTLKCLGLHPSNNRFLNGRT